MLHDYKINKMKLLTGVRSRWHSGVGKPRMEQWDFISVIFWWLPFSEWIKQACEDINCSGSSWGLPQNGALWVIFLCPPSVAMLPSQDTSQVEESIPCDLLPLPWECICSHSHSAHPLVKAWVKHLFTAPVKQVAVFFSMQHCWVVSPNCGATCRSCVLHFSSLALRLW